MTKIHSRLTAAELEDFARLLDTFDQRGLQVEGTVFIEGTGYMTVEFDGQRNVVTALEGIE